MIDLAPNTLYDEESLVDARLAGIQVCTPYDVELLATMRGTIADERALHRSFAHLRHRGEWFRVEAELLDYIAERCR